MRAGAAVVLTLLALLTLAAVVAPSASRERPSDRRVERPAATPPREAAPASALAGPAAARAAPPSPAASEPLDARWAAAPLASLLGALDDGRVLADPKARAAVIEALRREAEAPAAAAAIAAAADGAGGRLAALALARAEGAPARAALLELLAAHPDPALRLAALQALPPDEQDPRPFALALERAARGFARRAVLTEIARREVRVGEEDALLRAARAGSDPLERAFALQLVNRRADPRDAEPLRRLLDEGLPAPLRGPALLAYAATGGEAARPWLEELARTAPDRPTRSAALSALARLPGPSAADALRRAAEAERDPDLRAKAHQLIAALARSRGGAQARQESAR